MSRPVINEDLAPKRTTTKKVKHMKQKIIKSIGALTNLGAEVIGGLNLLETDLHIVHIPKLKVEVDLLALLTGNDAFQSGRLLLSARRETVRTLAKQGCELIKVTRDTLKPRFGAQFSNVWEILGFNDSLEAPIAPEEVKPMVRAIQVYMAANPTLEVPALGITAAAAGTLYEALNQAIIAVNTQDSALGVLRDTREGAMDMLATTVRSLVDELGLKLAPLDPRWKAFGLNMPGADETPDGVEGLKAMLIGPTAAALKWEAAPRAEYYRVWIRVLGVDAEYRAVGSPADIDFTIENLPTNATIDIVVSAVNNGGEGARSEAVRIVTH
ncbi:MAG: hypothetical protein JWM68_415 [Verrucomicrobiales bacterium]|nr:hypothetical protein [Verrucomicrobiales bacterium]